MSDVDSMYKSNDGATPTTTVGEDASTSTEDLMYRSNDGVLRVGLMARPAIFECLIG